MSEHAHFCPHCQRPRDGLCAEQILEVLTANVPAAALIFRARHLRRLADRIGACACPLPARAPAPRLQPRLLGQASPRVGLFASLRLRATPVRPTRAASPARPLHAVAAYAPPRAAATPPPIPARVLMLAARVPPPIPARVPPPIPACVPPIPAQARRRLRLPDGGPEGATRSSVPFLHSIGLGRLFAQARAPRGPRGEERGSRRAPRERRAAGEVR